MTVQVSTASRYEGANTLESVFWFYKVTFKFGFHLPIPFFIQAFLSYFDLASEKLILNWWRTILAIQILKKVNGFSLVDHWYFTKTKDQYLVAEKMN